MRLTRDIFISILDDWVVQAEAEVDVARKALVVAKKRHALSLQRLQEMARAPEGEDV